METIPGDYSTHVEQVEASGQCHYVDGGTSRTLKGEKEGSC